jgi:TRAP transporter 4TM/12TM fusion protein
MYPQGLTVSVLKGIKMDKSRKVSMGVIITALAVLMSIYQLISNQYVFLTPIEQQNIHLFFALIIIFLSSLFDAIENKKSYIVKMYMTVMILLTIASTIYVHFYYNEIIQRIGLATPIDLICGIMLISIAMEATRLTFGPAIPVLTFLSIVYMFVGPWMPGIFYHGGFSLERTISSLSINLSSGIYGTLLGISSTFVSLFMIFGGLLGKSGGSQFFMDLGMSISGKFRAGPAFAAVVSSGLMGSINGSAVANVATTGVFTIPMMRRRGYSANFAGAVEASASTGGMFLPPIMGIGAFVMAEITGISYVNIALSAAIPGLLYFLLIAVSVHFRSAKLNLQPVEDKSIPSFFETIKDGGIFLIPIILIIVYFIRGYSPIAASIVGIKGLFVVYFARLFFLSPKKILSWEPWKTIIFGLEDGIKSLVGVAAILACIGVMVQAIIVTGLAQRAVALVLSTGENTLIALLISMATAIFFGLGVPTTASYILLAVLAAPALVQIGLPLLPVHLFLYYFTIMANITPPVGSAAIIATRIAGAQYNKLCFIALRLSLSAIVLPFVFVYRPELLGLGDALKVIEITITAAIGLISVSAFFEGYFIKNTNLIERIILGLIGTFLIMPLRIEFSIGSIFVLLCIAIFQFKNLKKVKTSFAEG